MKWSLLALLLLGCEDDKPPVCKQFVRIVEANNGGSSLSCGHVDHKIEVQETKVRGIVAEYKVLCRCEKP